MTTPAQLATFFMANAYSRRDMALRYLRLAHEYNNDAAFLRQFRDWIGAAIADVRRAKEVARHGK